MTTDGPAIELSRAQVLAFRRRAGVLDHRLPWTADAVGRAAHAGLTDSVPRAALLSLHARLDDVGPDALDDPALVQLWGPRFSVYAVTATDVAVFTLGRLPRGGRGRRRADEMARRLRTVLEPGEPRRYGDVGRDLGVNHNALRYAAPTGCLLVDWDGARQPTIRLVEPPDVDHEGARSELARRFLRVLGPADVDSFRQWASVTAGDARATFAALADELVDVRGPTGVGVLLAADEEAARTSVETDAPDGVRLLPSGDSFWLLHGDRRSLLVEDADRRAELWPSRVWPGAILRDGEVVGTWRRAGHSVTLRPWPRLPDADRRRIAAAATALPLPGLDGPLEVTWDDDGG